MADGTGIPVIYDNLAYLVVVNRVISNTQFYSDSLISLPNGQFAGYSVWVLAKADGTITAPKGELPVSITGFTGTGNTNPGIITHAAFTASLVAGDIILLLHPSIANATAGTTKTATSASVTANWQTAETNLVTIGTLGQIQKLHSVNIYIGNTIGNISIRAYAIVNGVERQIFPIPAGDTFTVVGLTPDPVAIPIVNGTMGIYGTFRITCQSDNVADNGVAIQYTYITETG